MITAPDINALLRSNFRDDFIEGNQGEKRATKPGFKPANQDSRARR
jgi:hypothetical protein